MGRTNHATRDDLISWLLSCSSSCAVLDFFVIKILLIFCIFLFFEQIAARPGSQHLRCLYRASFVPKDAYELLRKDPVAFEYLYTQASQFSAEKFNFLLLLLFFLNLNTCESYVTSGYWLSSKPFFLACCVILNFLKLYKWNFGIFLCLQCCNDVVGERFAPELKYEVALRLAALQILQHSLAHNLQGKLTVKAIE